MSKPADFYLGTVNFFAILIPGAVVTAILRPIVERTSLDTLGALPAGSEAGWVAFLVASYFLGHLVFHIGSIADWFYDPLRRTLNPLSNESAYRAATDIRDTLLAPSECRVINTFQWSRAVLITQFPAAANDVSSLEADSKFFRSLMIVFLIAGTVLLRPESPGAGMVAYALAIASFVRYYERRLKCTTQAYLYIVTLHRLGKLTAGAATDGEARDPLDLA